MRSFRERVRALSEPERQVYEASAERFEEDSQSAGGEPDLSSFLPPYDPPRLLVLVHLIRCDMENRQRRGQRRRLEDYLARFPALAADPSAQLELLVWEYRLTRSAGVRAEDCEERFPDLAESFRTAVALLELPGPWIPPAEYEIDEQPLGKGGWGVVYKARHKRLGRIEALKVVDPGLGCSGRARTIRTRIERLRNEIPVAARLNHPNIVHLYTDGESGGHPYFVMEFCGGGDLKARLAGNPLSVAEAAMLIRTLAEAVDAVHAFGLIHRDLKPSNVLFGEGGTPKIADFGLALPCQEGSKSAVLRELAGTPAYMAPEQADPCRGQVGPATDVYALGAILYECLTGRPPFQGASGEAVLEQLLRERPRPPRELVAKVPLDLEAVCLKCLEKEPVRRYGSARALADDLGRFLSGEPVRARPQRTVRRAVHWCRRNPIKAAVVLLSVVAASIFFQVRADVAARDMRLANERGEQAERVSRAEKLRATAQERERRRAEQLAAAERLVAHTARVSAARQSARRGDWRTALPEYDRAIRAGEGDALRLRVERLVGFFALNLTADLSGELDTLERAALGNLAAQVKLIRGAWLLCDDSRGEQGRERVREALKERQHLFSPADVAFAEALAAEHIGAAIACLRRAVAADPLHYLATTSLVVALAVVGEREEVRRQTAFLHGVFPYSPLADFAAAVVAFEKGDRASLKEKLSRMVEKLPPQSRTTAARLEQFLLPLIELQELLGRLSSRTGFAEVARAVALLVRIKRTGALPNLEPLGLPVPLVGLIQRRFLDVLSAYVEVGPVVKLGLAPPSVLPRLEALNADYPDAGVLLLTAIVRAYLAIPPLNRGDLAATRKHLEAVADLSARATLTTSMLPHSSVSYLSRGVGMVADVALLKLLRQPDPVHLRRLRENLHLLVAVDGKCRALREPLLSLFVQMTVAPLVRQQCGDWALDTPAGQAAFHKRRSELKALCRALLEDWAIDEGSAGPTIHKLQQELEKWSLSSGILSSATPSIRRLCSCRTAGPTAFLWSPT